MTNLALDLDLNLKTHKDYQKLLDLEIKCFKNPSYCNDIRYIQFRNRMIKEIFEEDKNRRYTLAKIKFGIQDNEFITTEEIKILIGYVINQGLTGRKALDKIKKDLKKSDKWRQDVAKQRANKKFKKELENIKDNDILKRMLINDVYNEKDIMNNSLTGALTKLQNQRAISVRLDELENKVKELQENIAKARAGEDWKSKAIELYEQEGMKPPQIAKQLGVGRSTVYDLIGSRRN